MTSLYGVHSTQHNNAATMCSKLNSIIVKENIICMSHLYPDNNKSVNLCSSQQFNTTVIRRKCTEEDKIQENITHHMSCLLLKSLNVS